MYSLFLDCSFEETLIGISEDGKCLATFECLSKHIASITEQIQLLLDAKNISLQSLSYLICSKGPGSYTGLRNAAAIIKSTSYVLNRPIVPISSLLRYVPATFYINEAAIFAVITDAKIGGVYYQLFHMCEHTMSVVEYTSPQLLHIDETTCYTLLQKAAYIVSPMSVEAFCEKCKISYHTHSYLIDELIGKKRYYSYSISNFHHIFAHSHNAFIMQQTVMWNEFYIEYLRKTQAEIEQNKDKKNTLFSS